LQSAIHKGKNYKKDFSLQPNLPGQYGFIKEESVAYDEGTGVDNEDELEDIRQEQIRKAEEAKREEEERKRKYLAQMAEREAAEEERRRQEEIDRRLALGVERRRLVREHIDGKYRSKS